MMKLNPANNMHFSIKGYEIILLAFLTVLVASVFGYFVHAPVQAQNATEADQQSIEELREQVDETAVIQDASGLDLELTQKTQNPLSKEITYQLTITPQITSDRVKLFWFVEGVSRIVDEGQGLEQNLSVVTGQPITRSITISPQEFGLTEVSAVIEANLIDGDRISTAKKTIATNSDGGLLFDNNNSTIVTIVTYVRIAAIAILGIIVAVFVYLNLYQVFNRWVSSPDT